MKILHSSTIRKIFKVKYDKCRNRRQELSKFIVSVQMIITGTVYFARLNSKKEGYVDP
jgi:hypothetical protein